MKFFVKGDVKKLCDGKVYNMAGRNFHGKITARYRGGKCDRFFRLVDFKKFFWNFYAIVLKFSYDPNRTAPLMLVCYLNGCLSYQVAIAGLKLGDFIFVGELCNRKYNCASIGTTTIYKDLKEGTLVNNLEIMSLVGAQFVRAAGCAAQLLKIDKKKKWVLVRLPSKEERFFFFDNICTIGQIANVNHGALISGLAGRNRRLGLKPVVRGVAMNPVDHPHGGGQGKTSGAGGFRSQVTFTGRVAKMRPTRDKKKNSFFIMKHRK